MVPGGGLFVPESLPSGIWPLSGVTYQETATSILSALLTDFSSDEIQSCIRAAYNHSTFDIDSVIGLRHLNQKQSVMELWHGPTAAFKDVALQIMPQFMHFSKTKTGNTTHTVILVATSGDTGKAALEGFKNREGVSIIVFYPHGGVSEIQRLQMATTDGNNTHVVAVKGNFDDCQTGVKEIFSDNVLTSTLTRKGVELSSANSINWGRLCPQIVYYFRAYQMIVNDGTIKQGEEISFCVPTGNFGNILAGFYAKKMGLPIKHLICASNKNRILSDFFTTGIYDRNREFYKTVSPSMDILISSNLERFLFEMNGKNGNAVSSYYNELSRNGVFTISRDVQQSISSLLRAGWVAEQQVFSTIGETYRTSGYILDTHTAVGVSACNNLGPFDEHVIIASTASPYKFSKEVLRGIDSSVPSDEFSAISRIAELNKEQPHRAVDGLRERTVRHDRVIDIGHMQKTVLDIINTLQI
jgi:threonine synthase